MQRNLQRSVSPAPSRRSAKSTKSAVSGQSRRSGDSGFYDGEASERNSIYGRAITAQSLYSLPPELNSRWTNGSPWSPPPRPLPPPPPPPPPPESPPPSIRFAPSLARNEHGAKDRFVKSLPPQQQPARRPPAHQERDFRSSVSRSAPQETPLPARIVPISADSVFYQPPVVDNYLPSVALLEDDSSLDDDIDSDISATNSDTDRNPMDVSDGVWISSKPQDMTFHLAIEVHDDLEPDLEEFSRLSRLGRFRSAQEFFQQKLWDQKQNPWVMVQYLRMFLEKGSFSEVGRLAFEGPRIDDLLDLWRLMKECGSLRTRLRRDSGTHIQHVVNRRHAPMSSTSTTTTTCQIIVSGLRYSREERHRDVSILSDRYPGHKLRTRETIDGLPQSLVREGRLWDYHDIALEQYRDLGTPSEFEIDNILETWLVPQYHESTYMALLSILADIVASSASSNPANTQLAKKYAMQRGEHLSKAIATSDPEMMRSRPYLKWILAKAVFWVYESPRGIQKAVDQIDQHPGFLIPTNKTDPIFTPVYIPAENENPGWAKVDTPSGVVESVRTGLELAKDLEDYAVEASFRKLLVHLSPYPMQELENLATFQRVVQGDVVGYLESTVSAYLFADSPQMKDRVRRQLLGQDAFLFETFHPILQASREMVLWALTSPKERWTEKRNEAVPAWEAIPEALYPHLRETLFTTPPPPPKSDIGKWFDAVEKQPTAVSGSAVSDAYWIPSPPLPLEMEMAALRNGMEATRFVNIITPKPRCMQSARTAAKPKVAHSPSPPLYSNTGTAQSQRINVHPGFQHMNGYETLDETSSNGHVAGVESLYVNFSDDTASKGTRPGAPKSEGTGWWRNVPAMSGALQGPNEKSHPSRATWNGNTTADYKNQESMAAVKQEEKRETEVEPLLANQSAQSLSSAAEGEDENKGSGDRGRGSDSNLEQTKDKESQHLKRSILRKERPTQDVDALDLVDRLWAPPDELHLDDDGWDSPNNNQVRPTDGLNPFSSQFKEKKMEMHSASKGYETDPEMASKSFQLEIQKMRDERKRLEQEQEQESGEHPNDHGRRNPRERRKSRERRRGRPKKHIAFVETESESDRSAPRVRHAAREVCWAADQEGKQPQNASNEANNDGGGELARGEGQTPASSGKGQATTTANHASTSTATSPGGSNQQGLETESGKNAPTISATEGKNGGGAPSSSKTADSDSGVSGSVVDADVSVEVNVETDSAA
ncbi:hypothetical protein MKZ38_004454 [Zalerion maritima]|uniref:Uncharacterized protein n=1 Tax=Zalerion maritima TaxID=339359 RepID=A0AAD5WV21_9PEZI|nr:hypothetical protein MKZ38_004454 [Zalerion maritima]